VVGKVVSYREARISILGAVNEPGSYLCHSDEMTLVNLIMKAKGIVNDGAAVIRICRADDANGNNAVVLPVKGLNIPFADVALNEGDIVEVEQLNPQVFTVIGLVNKSGVFSYPPGVRYNLMQALAFAGGVNKIAAPRYARVYRQCADGSVISASFRLKGTSPVDAANLVIKPGDIVAVEQTFSTQTRLLFAQIFRVTTGLNAFATYRLDTSFEDATSRSND
jgi:protein involved in polysaccharide export with SLBB domain